MVDTRDKRASAVGEFSFWEVLPGPDSSINQGDRMQVAWVYRGIAPRTPTPSHFHTLHGTRSEPHTLHGPQSQSYSLNNKVSHVINQVDP